MSYDIDARARQLQLFNSDARVITRLTPLALPI